jgi:DNA polymerase
MMTNAETIQRVARQHLRTNQLLGVDFIPVRPGSAMNGETSAPAGASRAPAASADEVFAAPVTVPARSVAAPVGRDSASATDKAAKIEALRERHDAKCPHCTVATAHTRTVFGEGDLNAKLMFIGEAPGAEEDKQGRPFVGRSGQKLEQIITAMGLTREQVYIANVLKSRPPNNRTPLQPEIDACSTYLHEQIGIIQPEVIVTLGGPAAKLLLRTDIGITKLRGMWAEFVDDIDAPTIRIPVMPTFHPAYLLRNYTPETRQRMWSDMQQVMSVLAERG